jgi:hypothetical protein
MFVERETEFKSPSMAIRSGDSQSDKLEVHNMANVFQFDSKLESFSKSFPRGPMGYFDST